MDREKVIKGLGRISEWLFQQYSVVYDGDAPNYYDAYKTVDEAIELLKEQETVQSKTIPEELKQKMWNALYAEEDKFEEKYVGTEEHDAWFFIYRPWLQKGFGLAIKAIADWEGR